ncbi:lipid-A-disaccharide synthase-like uncharacterized protein [Albidovulum inexpectatum]|uniref:Lipid-A-disaccharide synthase-like uncharacterized protein n=1 Tax=Albidovulum inexpectatum TaxID=196587 RepID=A0A2S5JDN7_9RHOB|nr:lipid-A-disaccharide synthase N-terminal domain-containing protein [Albidovulum inexpectatum]PPB79604.1 lipid-A-disaccharide synthase-like uncharacterized protein [Albidovulum inexpectatum]
MERVFAILHVSGWAEFWWVAFGLLGQLMFTGRFLVQWIASERARRSVVPLAFWYLSMAGGLILLSYAIWRRDVVFILGQSTGVFIYARNLYLIHRERNADA